MKSWKKRPQKLIIISCYFFSNANRPKSSPNLNSCSIKISCGGTSIQLLCLQAMKKARLSRILRVIQALLTTLLVHFGYWVQLHEVVNSELKPIVTVTHIFCILFWIFIIFSFQPGYILCSQMTCNLMKSSEEIFLDDIRTKVILKNTLRFIKRTKRTSKLLSPIYFHLLLCAFEPLTFRIYQLIDFGFSQSPHHVLLYFGIVTDILGCGLTDLWILNTQSEDLKQQFKSIVMRKLSKKSITGPLRHFWLKS